MPELNYLAVLVAAVAAFGFSAVYYAVLSPRMARWNAIYGEASQPSPALIVIELVRALVVAVVVATLVGAIGFTDIAGALLLAASLWVAFPVVLLVGSVVHERVPAPLAAIHAGDWLVKLVLISLIVTLWR